MDILGLIGFVVGIVSFVASIIFFLVGAKSERRNQDLLNKINEAIQRWQSGIMESSIDLLNSRPEIVAKNTAVEETRGKQEFIRELSERIRYVVERSEGPHAQSHALTQLLETFEKATK